MPMPLPVSAATMPAMAVPWPFGSLFQAEPSTNDAPPTMFAVEVGMQTSTPVSRTATTEEPVGETRAVGLVPADLRQRPLVPYEVSSGVAFGGAAPVELDGRDASVRAQRIGSGVRGLDRVHPEGGDRVDVARAGVREAADCSADDVPATKVTMYAATVTGGGRRVGSWFRRR